MPDRGDWLDRLDIIGLDVRQPTQVEVVALAATVAGDGPLDILINNAARPFVGHLTRTRR